VRAFNRDLPYDRFVLEQLAGDLLPPGSSNEHLAALGFLTVGDRRNGQKQEIIDDRIDVVTRGFMGLTVACSRCHDHKYDPIPTADYYSLYGVFASTKEPKELPIIGKAPNDEVHAQYRKKRQALEALRDQEISTIAKQARAEVLVGIGDYLARAHDPNYKKKTLALRNGQVKRWTSVIRAAHPDLRPVLAPLRATFGKQDTEVKRLLQEHLNKQKKRLNVIVVKHLQAVDVRRFEDVAAVYGSLFAEAQERWRKALEAQPKTTALKDANWEQIRLVLTHPNGPIAQTDDEARRIFGQSENDSVRKKQSPIDRLDAQSPGAPPRAMVLHDGKLEDPVIFKRGNASMRGDTVPRQFLAMLAGADRTPFSVGSGRLEMAEAIVSPDNPLTARVLVNRVWHWHFGRGLVRTVDNFGVIGDTPSHPELLDYLAEAFVQNGYSVKWLHRHILSSKTYCQASVFRPASMEIDPENVLLWRFPRKRLDFEALRDAILQASGGLNKEMGGQPFDLAKRPFGTRRSIYAFIDRTDLSPDLPIFDFASPTASTGLRPDTTVPQQALYMLNGPFVLGQARALALSEDARAIPLGAARVRYFFRQVLSREPSKDELERSLRFIAETPKKTVPAPMVQLVQTLLSCNEFTFTD
jgi:hypothetical protein